MVAVQQVRGGRACAPKGEKGATMSDLISREEVHKILNLLSTEGGNDAKMLFMDAHEFINELPSAESEWIPCSERMPKAEDMYQPPEQRYLCQLEAHGMRKFCVLSRLKGAVSPFWDWYGIAIYDSEVIAWMPLPTPYREENEE